MQLSDVHKSKYELQVEAWNTSMQQPRGQNTEAQAPQRMNALHCV